MHVWNRWLRQYLPGLIPRKKWFHSISNLKIGDLILVVDYSVPRGCWPLGRVLGVFPGQDNIVRSAEIKTKSGVLKRPVTKLALLEDCSSK